MGDGKFSEHACNPRNVGLLDDANVVIQAGDPGCDDRFIFFMKIDDDVVQDIRFLIEGCDTTVATSSVVTELVMGQPLDKVLELSEHSITGALVDFPEEKIHCPVIAVSALQAAVEQYRSTPKGEASSNTFVLDHCRVVAQILDRPLAESYSSEYDL